MICCKCERPIDRSYGRVTDLGNYCRECAILNEKEYQKAIFEKMKEIRKEASEETAEKIITWIDTYYPCYSRADLVKELAKQFGVEIKE